VQPGDTDTPADGKFVDALTQLRDLADDLMAGDNIRPSLFQLAFDDMQVRPADAAG
jgi:hypothetical protein